MALNCCVYSVSSSQRDSQSVFPGICFVEWLPCICSGQVEAVLWGRHITEVVCAPQQAIVRLLMRNYPALGHDPQPFESLPSSFGVLPCKLSVFPFHKYVLGRHFQIMQFCLSKFRLRFCFLSYFCPLILHSRDEP